MIAVTTALACRYLTRFRCITSDCEETCCSQWEVEVEEGAYLRLEQLMQASPAERAAFERAFARVAKRPAGSRAHALLCHRPDGFCQLLDEKHLCLLHQRYGEQVLPDACASFPRWVSRVGDRLEVTATLACPEIARLALLGDDALELVAAEPSLLCRDWVHQQVDEDEPDPYRHHFRQVRDALLEVLADPRHPLDGRLYFVACFAAAVSPFYYRESDCFHSHLLDFELDGLRSPAVQDLLASRLALVPDDPGVAAALLQVLRARLAAGCSTRFARLVESAISGCEATDGDFALPLFGRPRTVSWQALREHHAQRRHLLLPLLGARLERIFERYLRQVFLRDWFLSWQDLFLHTQMTLIRVALLRFLLFGHPQLAAAARASDPAEQGALVDRATVEVFSATVRALDHNPSFSEKLAEAVAAMRPQTPIHSAMLINF